VSIPIFPMLYAELQKLAKEAGPKRAGYVFPEQARMYLDNADGITWRVKKILAEALGESLPEAGDEPKALPEVSAALAREGGEKYIAALPEGEKRSRMATVFRHYMDGNNIKAVMAEANVSKGSVSGYLNEIEQGIGCRIVRGSSHANKGDSVKDGMRDAGLYVEREHGLRRASVRDFHSFRVTWVTLALTAGVALELVQKVTGHKTTDIVLKHYFQPGREAFRTALNKAMPALLTYGAEDDKTVTVAAPLAIGQTAEKVKPESPKPEPNKREQAIQKIVAGMTAKTWKKDQARIKALLAET